ncbi:methyltransferase domain-containing protein [Limimaricola litoreus]|uniref:Methyltransferase domain-containing protein n=1 Tax=Limimaricola litoreus TaxID=2955316 RepID=A0A9X2FMF2_9RHOB|nr:methyltransferase domain-containing protein [Limimaricola litoreus]MCP1166982.1 methyltransferase domain-containing protein [Limimaricola litoreus]
MSPPHERVARAFRRGLPSYHGAARVQAKSAQRLAGMLAADGAGPRIGRALEFGCGTGLLTRALHRRFAFDAFETNDLLDEARDHLPEALRPAFRPGPIERLPLRGGYDLIASGATIQWIADPAALLARMSRHLAPGGRLLIGGFGRGHFAELAALASPAPLFYADPDDWPALLPPGLVPRAAERRHEVLGFDDLPQLLRHLRATGVTGNARAGWGRAAMRAVEQRWRAEHGLADGRLGLSYVSVHLVIGAMPGVQAQAYLGR